MRIPPIPPDDLTPEQRPLHDAMRAGIEKGFRGFVTTREDGALLGPFNPWLHEPRVSRAAWDLTEALAAMFTLPDPCRQVAILVTGAHFDAGYEVHAHAAVARQAGLPEGTVGTIIAGQRPADLPAEQAVAFDTASALLRGGPLPDPVYQHAVRTFGPRGAAELVHLVGMYCLVSVTLNGFDVPVPEGEKG